MKPLRLIFMGTPEFSVPALNALAKSNHDVVAVYSQPPRPAGRGMAARKSPIHQCAEDLGIPVFTPENFKNPDDIDAFQGHEADFAVVAAYGLLLPEAILTAPKFGCINIHASLLPRWRGASPIQAAILAGDQDSGNAIMQMEKGLDTGPVFTSKRFELEQDETASSLHDKLSMQAGEMIIPAIEGIVDGQKATKQNDDQATYAPKISKDDAKITWGKPATEIDRAVRAFTPHPGAWFTHQGKRLRILEGEPVDKSGKPGEVLDSELTIACAEGAYKIKRLQKEGRKSMTATEFLRGQDIPVGTILD